MRIIHRFFWRRYHIIFVFLIILWAAVAFINPTGMLITLSVLMISSYFFDVLCPYHALNAVACKYFIKPVSINMCKWLSAYKTINIVIIPVAVLFCVVAIMPIFELNSIAAWLLMPLAVISGHTFLTGGFFSFVKLTAVGQTRIIVFRRFSSENAKEHRTAILPITGSYGYLVLYDDETLNNSDMGLIGDIADLLGGRFYYMEYGDLHWDKLLEYELSRVDFVVFDWSDLPTEAMLYEFHLALEFLPSDRLIWIVPEKIRSNIINIVTSKIDNPNIISRDTNNSNLSSEIRAILSNAKITERNNAHKLDWDKLMKCIDAKE